MTGADLGTRSMLFNLTGKVAVITGSSRGIGKATALQMALHGPRVMISSRNMDACQATAREINERCGDERAHPVAASISSKEQLSSLVEGTLELHGRLDILVCNAASNPFFGPMSEIPDEAFRKILDNNIVANHWLARLAAPAMKRQGGGSIIIVSSSGACAAPRRSAPTTSLKRPTCSLPATSQWSSALTTSGPTALPPG